MGNKTYLLLFIVLAALAFSTLGCAAHGQGETASEGSLRHQRFLQITAQQFADDVDMVLMIDKPGRLNYLRVR